MAKLQIACSDGNSTDNSPLKRALELLRDRQQSLYDRIYHEISPEEQLYYVYMIDVLNKSLIEYQGSLEQLQSSHEVAMLVNILLNIGHSSPESDLGHQVVGHDMFLLLISTFSSVINDHGIYIVDEPIVLEALESVEVHSAFMQIYKTGTHDIKYTTEGKELCATQDENGSSPQTVNSKREGSYDNKKVLGIAAEARFYQTQDKKAEEFCPTQGESDSSLIVSQRKEVLTESNRHQSSSQSLDMEVQDSVRFVDSAAGVDHASQREDSEFPSSLSQIVDKNTGEVLNCKNLKDYVSFSLVLQFIFANFFNISRKLKNMFKKGGRDGYKRSSVPNRWDMDVQPSFVTHVEIPSHKPDSIPTEIIFPVKGDETLPLKTMTQQTFVKVNKAQNLSLEWYEHDRPTSARLEVLVSPFSRWSKGLHLQQPPLVLPVSADQAVSHYQAIIADLIDSTYETISTSVSRASAISSGAHQWAISPYPANSGDQAVSADLFTTPPPQPPVSWCWKKRIDKLSVADLLHFTQEANIIALTELDTECHETICHAIVSEITAPSSFTLIHALHERSQCFFSTQDKNGDIPLHIAVVSGHIMVVKQLVDLHPAAVHILNNRHATPLDIAIDLKHHNVIDCLLRGVVQQDPHSTSTVQLLQSCLLKAMKTGYTHCLQVLLQLQSEYGLTIDFECTDSDGHTAWYYLKQKEHSVQASVVNILRSSSPSDFLLLCKLFRMKILDIRMFPQLLQQDNTDTCRSNGTYTPQNDLSEAYLDQEAMKVPVACNAEHRACNLNVKLENYKSEQMMVQATCEKESLTGDSTTDALPRKENSFCKERGFSCNDYITKSKSWELEIPSSQEDAVKLQDQWSFQRDEPICPTSPTTHYDGDLPTFYKMALDEEYPPSERPIQINHTLDSDNGDTQWSYKSSQPSSLTLSDVPCMPPKPDPAVVEAMNSNIIFQYSSTEDSNNAAKKPPFMYQQQYTDSVTSSPSSVDRSPPRVRTISKAKRARAKRRLFQHRMPTSGSDIKEESFGKINQHRRRRRRRTARRDVRSESYTDYESSSNHTDFESSSCSSKEDSEISRQIDDEVTMNHSTASITGHQSQFSSAMHVVGIKPCVNAKLREKYSPRRKHKLRSTSNAYLTEHYFCSIDGTKLSFNSDHFKVWLSSFIHNSGYCRLKRLIHPQLLTVFGFCPLKRSYLTTIQKKMARAIIEVGSQCKKNAIPKKVVQNLMVLEKFVFKDHQGTMPSVLLMLLRGKGQRNCKKDAMAKNKSTGTEAQKRPTNFNGAANHCDSLVSQDKYTKSSSENSSEVPTQNVAQEVSSGENVLQFSSASNPLDVIHSHMKVYSKCCVRHDIHNIIVFGTTIPASDIFGPKRRYASAKDLRSDQKHGDLNSLQEILAKSGNRQYPDQESRQVMLDSPVPESTRKGRLALPHTATNTIEAHLDDHSSHNNSRQHDSLSTHVVTENQVDQTERKITNGYEIQRTTEPQYQHKHLAPATTASSTHQHSFRTSRALQFNDTPPPEPDDHKDRLQSTAELLHAQDYGRIIDLAYGGEPPSFFSTELKIPYIFITGLAYYKMSNHKKSVQYFQICLEMAEECHRDGDVTICNIYIGDIDFSKRKYTDAAVRYQSALYHYSRDSVAKDFRMILPTKSAVWLKCGSAFKNGSRMGDAVAAYEKAVELASSKKDQLSAHTSLGNLFQGIGENGRAMKEYEAAIVLATELEDNISLGWNHGNLGNALLGLHQRDKALYHLFKALDMAVVHEMTPQAIGRAYNNLGTAFQSLNELSKAEEQYDLALAQGIYGNDIAGQARVYGNIGNLQMLSKQYDRAVPHYTEVMRLSQDKATITTAHHNRGCAYYDWAEKKKKAFFARTIAGFSSHSGTSIQELSSTSESPRNKIKSLNVDSAVVPLGSQKDSASEDTSVMNRSPGFKVSLHGPDFKRCDEIYKPMFVPEGVQKFYLQGTRDLDYVIRHHEENFSGIKGSPKGLSLSVSLFESNSRTFHRMQDCLVHLQKSDDQPSRFEDALLVAEQSRARTLGELLLKRRGPQLEHQLKSPPSIHQLKSIVARQSCPVVYLSYTGERLLGWILYPTPDNECTINMFEVPLSDTEFDGKSFDYHLRYSLNEQLVEKSFEMYKPFDHQKDKTEPLEKLYDLVAQPLMTMLSKLDKQKQKEEDGSSSRDRSKPNTKVDQSSSKVRKIIIIPDSYTNLLPFTCVLDKETGKFWGDSYYFQIMPSLLTMGILDQLPTVAVSIPVQYQQMLCVVGNPTIPRFKFNNDDWDLGKLPHATKEAEWVSHILKCNPILHEQATKDAVMMRLMNAKVIHLATHGSAASGFLAFAGMNSSTKEAIDAKKVLIYPEEVESLNISPALVVLSSCDSGRGVFKADGIQGMARAFILAGAQAVLTALWRVPDESACIFMQFFYQYLVDGLRGTEALHKAILSLRCFSKYSQYIHWSGYQLTGREFQFNINQSPARAELTTRLGTSSVFPRLEILKELEAAFMNNPRPPTDVQVRYIFCFCSKAETLSLCIIIIYHLFVSGFAWTTWSEAL